LPEEVAALDRSDACTVPSQGETNLARARSSRAFLQPPTKNRRGPVFASDRTGQVRP
jgi:hypothetical protein